MVACRALLAPHAPKAAVERYWLLYTPVWGAISAVVMVGGLARTWGDLELMAFGVLLAVGALGPLARPADPERPWHQRTGPKLVASVVVLAFGLNWLQTPFFFDVLHMHYGFGATWVVDRNPLFLYLVTVAYFATYAALCTVAHRAIRRAAPEALRWLAWLVAPLAMAFLETLLNANPWMTGLFCYDDLPLMLWFGTLVYAIPFALMLPLWMAIDEDRPDALPLLAVVLASAAVVVVDRALLEGIRHTLAPLVTTVVDDAPGLRDFATSCLER